MAGNILHQECTGPVQASSGQREPDQTDPRVTVSGQQVMTVARSYTVSGCALNGTTSPPCTTAAWLDGRGARVRQRHGSGDRFRSVTLSTLRRQPRSEGVSDARRWRARSVAVGELDFPYRFDGRGRTATADADDHIRDLIEQVLFTSPGERVMRPDFGSGMLALVFEPNSTALAATTQILVQGALQQHLGTSSRSTGVRG